MRRYSRQSFSKLLILFLSDTSTIFPKIKYPLCTRQFILVVRTLSVIMANVRYWLFLVVAIGITVGSLPTVKADDTGVYNVIYDQVFGQQNRTIEPSEFHQRLRMLAEHNDLRDSMIKSLIEIGDFNSSGCFEYTFNRILLLQKWINSTAFNQLIQAPIQRFNILPSLASYVNYCMEQQYLVCRAELLQRLVNARDRWEPNVERNYNNLVQFLTRVNIDPMQPLGTQIEKFKDVLEEFSRNLPEPDAVWGLPTSESILRRKLTSLWLNVERIISPFDDTLSVYDVILQTETTARLVDGQALETITSLMRLREIMGLVDKILNSLYYQLHPDSN